MKIIVISKEFCHTDDYQKSGGDALAGKFCEGVNRDFRTFLFVKFEAYEVLSCRYRVFVISIGCTEVCIATQC